ncbi:signal-regulatory protein beta-2-like isoform X2 [Heterodontus francisci]|uniref:signal-regulatory protein beta-2-like isoform X2 n=1 Tax=Heterodontus francisci TaxID=7792 RepID=UPI00355BE340
MNLTDLLWTLMLLFQAHSGSVIIIQTPSIDVIERERACLPCTYIAKEGQTNGAFRWYKVGKNGKLVVSNSSTEYLGRIAMTDRRSFLGNNDASMTILWTRLEDSGTYYCQIEMFNAGTDTGPGTILTVKATANKIKVFQTPPSIEAIEGESVHLLCIYSTPEGQHIGTFSWYKDVNDGTEENMVSNTSVKYSGRILEVERSSFKANRNASIMITNVNRNDSGTYYCEVEISFVGKDTGQGTILTVKHPEKRGRSLLWQLLVMGVKLVVFVVIIIIIIYLVHFWDSRGSPMAITAEREEIDRTGSNHK